MVSLLCFVPQVHGILRRSSSFNTGPTEHLYGNPQTHTEGSTYKAVPRRDPLDPNEPLRSLRLILTHQSL